MTWSISGTYFENCNCDVVCPCTWSGFTRAATNDRCHVLLAFHIDSGEIEGVDVSGLSFGVVADTPGKMVDGNWRVGLLLDAAASHEQAAKLQGVATGELGGPMAGLSPLIGEVLGVERVPITYERDGDKSRARFGEIADLEVVAITSIEGKHMQLSNAAHPANSTLDIAISSRSTIDSFGIAFGAAGTSGFSAPFSWSA